MSEVKHTEQCLRARAQAAAATLGGVSRRDAARLAASRLGVTLATDRLAFAWDEGLHPRDYQGRFIQLGATVELRGKDGRWKVVGSRRTAAGPILEIEPEAGGTKELISPKNVRVVDTPKLPDEDSDGFDDSGDEAADLAADLRERAGIASEDVTPLLMGQVLAHGGQMEGLEFRRKAQDSMARKIRLQAAEKGVSEATIAARLNDSLRYTALFDTGAYSAGVRDILGDFEKRGYTIVTADNAWVPGNPYKGINATVETPEGTRFELQFHTPESFKTKMGNHADYEVARDPSRSKRDRESAQDRMRATWDAVPMPPEVDGIGRIRDFTKR